VGRSSCHREASPPVDHRRARFQAGAGGWGAPHGRSHSDPAPCCRDCVRSAGNAPSRGRGPCEGSRTSLAVGSRGDARASHRRRHRAHRGCAATRRPRIPQAECARARARRGSAFLGRDAWRRPQAARRHASPGASRGRRSRSAAPEPIVVAGYRHTPPEPPGFCRHRPGTSSAAGLGRDGWAAAERTVRQLGVVVVHEARRTRSSCKS
jgi:hypothetical protein